MTKHLDIDTKAMRAKILDLAIRGKLTDQRQEDGNAWDLLKEIQAEKERLIKEKKIKKEKPLPEIAEEEKPFEIPENWEWVRLGEIIELQSGQDFPKSKYSDTDKEGIPYITGASCFTKNGVLENRWTRFPKCIATKGDILLVCKGSGYGKITICNLQEAHIARQIMAIKRNKYLNLSYIESFLMARIKLIKENGQGLIPGISRDIVLNLLFPLPPLAEQQRIADKVSALFAQLDVIDKAYEEYQELQQAMKDKLLDLAIQGKLTDQRQEDGDARDLLKEIQAEKEKLIKEKKIKKEKPLPEIEADEIPFEIPKNWTWVRINDLFDVARGGSPRPIKAFLTEDLHGINWIKIGDTEIGGKYIYHVKEKIKPEGLKKSRFVKNGDLLLTNSMSYGRPYILKTDGCIHDGWLVLSPFIYSLNKEFFYYLISSQYVKREFTKTAVGAVVKNLNKNKVKAIIIPLPPLAEQKRIVAKMDELLPLL